MFLVTNSLKNIIRQRRRYRLFIPLLFVCSLLVGTFTTLVLSSRLYLDYIGQMPPQLSMTVEESNLLSEQRSNTANLGTTATVMQMAVFIISAAAVFYVASLMIGARFYDVGVMYSVGVTRRQIFLSFFVELETVCVTTLSVGFLLGHAAAVLYLNQQVSKKILPSEILDFTSGGTTGMVCVLIAAFILLLPLIGLVKRIISASPNELLHKQ